MYYYCSVLSIVSLAPGTYEVGVFVVLAWILYSNEVRETWFHGKIRSVCTAMAVSRVSLELETLPCTY